jgi:hypothetical protein
VRKTDRVDLLAGPRRGDNVRSFQEWKSHVSTNGPIPCRSRTSLPDPITPSTSGRLVYARKWDDVSGCQRSRRTRDIAAPAEIRGEPLPVGASGDSGLCRRPGVWRLAQTTLALAGEKWAFFKACSKPGRPLGKQVEAGGFAQENADGGELPLTILEHDMGGP